MHIDSRQVDVQHDPSVVLGERDRGRNSSNDVSSQSDEERSELGVEGNHLGGWIGVKSSGVG